MAFIQDIQPDVQAILQKIPPALIAEVRAACLDEFQWEYVAEANGYDPDNQGAQAAFITNQFATRFAAQLRRIVRAYRQKNTNTSVDLDG